MKICNFGVLLLCISLTYSYHWHSPKILLLTLSSNVTTRPIKQVCWLSLFHLFGNEIKKKFFCFAFRSLIRIFASIIL